MKVGAHDREYLGTLLPLLQIREQCSSGLGIHLGTCTQCSTRANTN